MAALGILKELANDHAFNPLSQCAQVPKLVTTLRAVVQKYTSIWRRRRALVAASPLGQAHGLSKDDSFLDKPFAQHIPDGFVWHRGLASYLHCPGAVSGCPGWLRPVSDLPRHLVGLQVGPLARTDSRANSRFVRPAPAPRDET